MRNGLPNFSDEAAHAARLKDLMVYRVERAAQEPEGGPWRLALKDSGGTAALTLPADRVLVLRDGKAMVTRATALAHGLGLPDEIRVAVSA